MCHSNIELHRQEIRYRVALRNQISILKYFQHRSLASPHTMQLEMIRLERLREIYCQIIVHMIHNGNIHQTS